MTDESNPSILEIAEQAMRVGENQREDWLREHCPPEKLTDAQRLIDEAQSLETEALMDSHVSVSAVDYAGERIGPYRIVKPLGQGGMGQVYLAERRDGVFEQEVAIKLIQSSSLSDLTVKQFADERQILAQLKHPNIAVLLDGGATEGGIPYVVMEYIEGQDLADYLKMQRPSLKVRLQLFQRICAAVSYAHRNLVIHRDIKPANVMVAVDGTPKLLDFGIAKSLEESADRTHTVSAALTPASASPEQVRGEVLTTASDVYSLGALLYYLLCERMPINASNQADWVEAVTREIPDMPSSYASQIPRDLDLIALKALEKDPERRYATADALAEDVERFVNDEPVSARPPSFTYRAKRFCQRNAPAVVASSLFVIALFAGVVISTVQTIRAEAALEHSAETAEFLQSIFTVTSPHSGTPLGVEATVGEMLELAVEQVEEQFKNDPSRQAELFITMATIYLANHSLEESQRLLNLVTKLEVEEELKEINGEIDRQLVSATLSASRGRMDSANEICLSIEDAIWNSDDLVDDLRFLGVCAYAYLLHDEAEALRVLERGHLIALDKEKDIIPAERSIALQNIANNYIRLKEHHQKISSIIDDAIRFARDAGNLAVLADAYRFRSVGPNQAGEAEESLRFTTLALEAAEASRLAKDSVTLAFHRLYQADRLIDTNRLEEAEAIFNPAREVILEGSQANSDQRAIVYFTDYKIAFKKRDFARAERALLTCQQIYLDIGDPNSPWVAQADFGLGKIYVEQGRYDEAVAAHIKGHEYYLNLYGADHPRTISHKTALDRAIMLRDTSKSGAT